MYSNLQFTLRRNVIIHLMKQLFLEKMIFNKIYYLMRFKINSIIFLEYLTVLDVINADLMAKFKLRDLEQQ